MWGWLWIAGVMLALGGCSVVVRHRQPPLIPESLYVVTYDHEAIQVTDPEGEMRRVTWRNIARVGIRTTDEGPLLPDLFWGIHSAADEPALVFPGGASGEAELLAELQRRLTGFRNDELMAAMRSTSNAYFVLWPPSR